MPLEADADNAPAPKQPEAQSANPDVMSILARLRAEKQETARPVESRRPSFSARSGRGVILDPYLSQLPQAQAQSIPRSASHRSKPSSEVGSLRSQPLASPRKFDDVDELEYMYALLKPKVKHAAKPATDKKIQKTMAASKVRQKLPAGMKIGSRSNSKEDTRVGKSHGRTNSAIEEWRNRNARSEGLAFTDNEELKLDAEEQKIIQEHRRANKQKRMSQMSQDIPTMETLQNDLDPSRPRYVEPVVRARKSQDLLRPAGPSTRPSYMSQGDRSDITPEKQRLMKALAMRKRQLGAGSRRTTDDTTVTLATQSAQAGRNLAETDVAGDKQDRRSTSQDWHSGSEEVKKHAEQDRTMEDLQLMAGSPRESEVAEHHDIVAANINRTPSQRTAQRLQVPQLDFLNPGRENGPLITDRRAEPAATDGHNASRYLAVGPSSPAKLQTPRLPSRRASHNTQGSGEDLEDGLSPSDSLMEELRLATVQEARMVATTSRSPEIFAREAPDMLPSPLGVPNAMTPSTTGEEVKASPVDSMLNGYPFPRTLDTVLEASSPEPSRKASTVKLNQHYFDARSPLAQETGGQRRAPTGGMPKNERRTSWLDVSQSSTHTTEEANFGTFLNLSRTTTGDSSVTSPMTPPVKNKSHNPRGNSRLPEIHPNARAEDTYAPPASEPDHDRTNTMSWGQRMLDSSPVKRTPSLSLFGRHRDRRAQSTTDLLHSDASPVKSSRSIRSGRDSTSSMSTITHHFGRHDTSGEQRRSSDVSRYFTGRKSSVGSLDPLGEEVAMKRGSGSWAMRTWKRYSASSRNSLTRLGEQCAEDGVTNTPLPVAKVPLAVREPKVPQPTASDTKSVSGPMVIGELNVQLPDSLVSPAALLRIVMASTNSYTALEASLGRN